MYTSHATLFSSQELIVRTTWSRRSIQ